MPTSGKVTQLPLSHLYSFGLPTSIDISDRTKKVMTPFSPLIPIQYLDRGGLELNLECSIHGTDFNASNLRAMIERGAWESLKSEEILALVRKKAAFLKQRGALPRLLGDYRADYIQIISQLNSFMEFCDAQLLDFNSRSIITNNTAMMAQQFSKHTVHGFQLRTYTGSIGLYSMTEHVGTTRKAHILATITQKDFHYQRMHIFLTGAIDMSRVIILVNEELENPEFSVPGLRKLYIGRLKPQIRETACQVYLVPDGYIDNTCFMKPFSLSSKKITDKQKEIDSLGKMFKWFIRTNAVNMDFLYLPPSTSVESPVQEVPKSVTLVAPVDHTPLLGDRLAELGVTGTPARSATIETLSANIEVAPMIELVNALREELLETVGIPAGREEYPDF